MSATDLFGHVAPTSDEARQANSVRMRQMAIRCSNTQPGAKAAHYSDEWYTPPEIPAKLGVFGLDPAAGPMRHARENWGAGIDGLALDWPAGRVWLNPPYSNVGDWLDRFVAHGNGICLVNARPETLWFQRLAKQADAVHWIRGRVNFIRPDGKPTHPPVGSVLVAIGPGNVQALQSSGIPGVTMLVAGDR